MKTTALVSILLTMVVWNKNGFFIKAPTVQKKKIKRYQKTA